MSRRKKPSPSSLELLLDTICNTFGGILFLAILTCVMLQNTTLREAPSFGASASQADLLSEQGKLATAMKRLVMLRTVDVEQQKSLKHFANPRLGDLVAQRQRLQKECDTLVSERVRLHVEIAELDERQRSSTARRAKLKHDLAKGDAAVKQALAILEAERARRSQDIRLPRTRPTSKREVGLIVRYNRLYVPHRYDRLGDRTGLNAEEFVLLKDSFGYAEATPKPYAGVPITGTEARAAIVGRLQQFDPSSCYVAPVVWPDSFQVFQTLKTIFIELGFEYRLIPVEDGEFIVDQGGRGDRVQ